MRISLLYRFMASSLEALQKHADIVKESTVPFQQAMECHFADACKDLNTFRKEIKQLKSAADNLKREARDNLPLDALMPVDKFQLYRYLREQNYVLDAMEDVLDWISYYSNTAIPGSLEKNIFILVDSIIDPAEELSRLVAEARGYLKRPSEKRRQKINAIIRTIRHQEHEADSIEDMLKREVFALASDPVSVFHLVQLAETIGGIADHAENAAEMMRAMLSK